MLKTSCCLTKGHFMTGADTLFQIDERSKFQTQKGLIFGLV
jgi:hypothetical protein